MRRDSSCSSGGKTEDSLGRACVGPPRDDAKAHRTWDRGRRSSSSSSSSSSSLPACKGSRAREGFGMGEAAVGEERRQHRGGRRGARRRGRGGAGAVTTSAATLTCTSAPVAPGPLGQFPGTAPLLGRGPLTCTLRGPFHLHTWTLAMKTPYWSLLGGASGPSCSRGRPPMRGPGGAPHGRCQPVRGARAGEGGGGGGGQWAGEVAGNGRVR